MPPALSFRMPAARPLAAPAPTAPPQRTRTRRHLDKLDPTSKRHFPTAGGRDELWSARSASGLWTYERDEAPGTPWVLTHRDHEGLTLMYPTITSARAAVADGSALAELEKQHAAASTTEEA